MKQIYTLLIALLMGLSANAEESGTCGPNLKWHLTDDGVLTISGKGEMDDYSVRYNGGAWDSSAPWRNFGVKRIIVGDSVTRIGDNAFNGCSSLTSVTIPNSVTTIGNNAFSGCSSLTSVTIPNSVTTIGWYTFSGCSSLTSVTIPNSVTTIGSNAFYNCKSLTSVTIPNSVTTIKQAAFGGCSSLTSVTIPNSVTAIGYEAFNNNAKIIWLTNTPPNGYSNVKGSIHYVANDLYTSLSNKKVYPYLSSIFEVDGIKYVPVSPSERTCDAIDCAYTGEPYEVKINKKVNYKGLDMTVREINPYTAYNCTKIKKAYIDIDGSIGNEAFNRCANLSTVNIAKVNNIGKGAFSGCTNLVSVDIKAGNNIGESAFRDCSSLKTLSLDTKIKSLGRSAFVNCINLKQFVIPDSVTILNDYLLSGASLKSIRIHKGIKEINKAFYRCTNLSTLIIEDRNTSLKLVSNNNPLFKDCKLDSVYIGGKIVYNTSSNYGYSPFYRNTSLRTVKISDAETTIYDNEFYGCTNLQNVSIGDNVKSIGKWAFSGCRSLKNFTFGSGLQSIGQEAFSDCFNITQISSEAVVPPTCGLYVFAGINKSKCKLIVPKNSLDAYKQAYQWEDFSLIEGSTTGITNTVNNKAGLADVYTIDGTKRLSKASTDEINALPKGVYIVNGKKIIIK